MKRQTSPAQRGATKIAKQPPAGRPEPVGRPNSDRSRMQEELERGLPDDQKRETPDKPGAAI
jgi:hypothetical protein